MKKCFYQVYISAIWKELINMPFDIYTMHAYSGLICAIVIGIIRNRARITKFKETIDKPLCRVMMFFICFCLVDSFWGVVGSSNTPAYRMLYIVSTYGFHTMSALSAPMCSYYCAKYMKIAGKGYKILWIIRAGIFIVQIAFLYQNIFEYLYSQRIYDRRGSRISSV